MWFTGVTDISSRRENIYLASIWCKAVKTVAGAEKPLWCKRCAPKGFFVWLLVYSEGSAESTDPWSRAAAAGVSENYLAAAAS